jgi:imidazole glycerol-phosphate synthase subunit HisH
MIAIIDYNAGNTKSVINALNRLNVEVVLTSDSEVILSADKVILPGVGHAATSMMELHSRNLIDTIKNVKVPFLGVCVGMQLMMDRSEEGDTDCLGIIDGEIKKLQSEEFKIPKMGWNTVKHNEDSLFKNIDQEAYYYFVHSYYLPTSKYEIATSNYIEDYSVAVKKDNFFGVQFHPEKSEKAGETLLKNFISIQ